MSIWDIILFVLVGLIIICICVLFVWLVEVKKKFNLLIAWLVEVKKKVDMLNSGGQDGDDLPPVPPGFG